MTEEIKYSVEQLENNMEEPLGIWKKVRTLATLEKQQNFPGGEYLNNRYPKKKEI